jgi:hypothetical protein
MIRFEKGQLITIQKVLEKGKKSYLQMGKELIEAEIRGELQPGEKLVVVSLSHEKILLKPYSRVFKELALSDLFKTLEIPENLMSRKLLVLILQYGLPLKKETIRKFYSQIRKEQIEEKWWPLLFLRNKEKTELHFPKTANSGNIENLLSFFLNLSTGEEIFLPVDPDGNFMLVRPGEKQVYFKITLELPALNLIHAKGWVRKDSSKGEVFCYFMPFIELDFFKALKEKIQKTFPDIQVYSRYFSLSNPRRIDGFF